MAADIFSILCFARACFAALVMTDLIVRPRATKPQPFFKSLQRSSFMRSSRLELRGSSGCPILRGRLLAVIGDSGLYKTIELWPKYRRRSSAQMADNSTPIRRGLI